ncbi:MAG: glutathione S-transferase family protein [Acetobacteraceae bacterium]|nr:glutathione S-transferase family protein [Acetobacteraceae bacterium]
MLRLTWSSRSPYVRKVMVAAHELGLAGQIETVPVLASMAGVQAAAMASNPLGKIPTLTLPDGEAVHDSLAICECLDAMAGGGRLFPSAGRARRDALRWHALADGLLDILLLWRSLRELPEDRQPPGWLEGFRAKVPAVLDRLEAEHPACRAAPFGIGQLTIGVALAYADFRFPDLGWRAGRPGLEAGQAEFEARPSARATVFHDPR